MFDSQCLKWKFGVSELCGLKVPATQSGARSPPPLSLDHGPAMIRTRSSVNAYRVNYHTAKILSYSVVSGRTDYHHLYSKGHSGDACSRQWRRHGLKCGYAESEYEAQMAKSGGGGVLGEGDVSFVPPVRGSNLVHFGMWTSHQNSEP